ncbi:hypothetical protein [Oceanobacillus kapialis]|uniref:Endolytic transglycosylase MltG n=1 Tax=Oceanobacillus kapialis TaxID=481353 RepID=A0ABW5Q599_9BACI
MKQSVRSFAIGLFTAGLLMLVGIFIFNPSGNNTEDLASEDLIDMVEEKGYYVLDKEEYIAASVGEESKTASAETTSEEQNDETAKEEENASKEQKSKDNEVNNSEANEEQTDESNSKNNDTENEAEQETEENATYTLNIKEGMASSEISSVLENNNIIDDAGEFNDYLIDNEYHLLVQIGEYELTTGMSQYEVAEAITN